MDNLFPGLEVLGMFRYMTELGIGYVSITV